MPGIPKAPWYEESELVKVKTLPEQAKAYGYKTAYIFWPLTMHADMPWVLHRASIHTPSEHEQDIIRQRSTPRPSGRGRPGCGTLLVPAAPSGL